MFDAVDENDVECVEGDGNVSDCVVSSVLRILNLEVFDDVDDDVDGVVKFVVDENLMGVIDEKKVLNFDMVVFLCGWCCCRVMLFIGDCVGE